MAGQRQICLFVNAFPSGLSHGPTRHFFISSIGFTFVCSFTQAMTTIENNQQEEQRERALALLRRMVADKRADEKKAIDAYQNNPELQALIKRLDQSNAERGTPIV